MNRPKLNNMWKKVERFLIRSTSEVIGIDIGTSAIKLAEIMWRNDQPVLRSIGSIDLPEKIIADGRIIDSEALADAISQAVTTSGAKAEKAVVAVNGRGVFVREVMFPIMVEAELREAIKWDMEKYVPFAPESYYYDFAIIGEANSGLERKVLLVAAPREMIDNIVDITKTAGLQPVAIDIEPLALYRTLAKAENSLVIDIGGQVTQLVIFQNGSPIVTRMIPLGGQRFTETVMQSLAIEYTEAEYLKQRQKGLLPWADLPEEQSDLHLQLESLVSELAREVRRTIEYYQIQNKAAVIEKIFLSGGGAKLDNLTRYFEEHLEKPVVMVEPMANIGMLLSFDKQYLRDIAPQFTVAIGLALRGGGQ